MFRTERIYRAEVGKEGREICGSFDISDLGGVISTVGYLKGMTVKI